MQQVKDKLLITGASGFLGTSVQKKAIADGFSVKSVKREAKDQKNDGSTVYVSSINENTDWKLILDDITTIIHCAAVVHSKGKNQSSLDELFSEVNVKGTLNLARQAAEAGVSKFIFISSIGVNGNHSVKAFTATDKPQPYDAYTESKYLAEKGLLEISKETGLDVVIIRPPLIYGPNAPGSFGALVNLVRKSSILPFGGIENKRSFVALDNLVDFIMLSTQRADANGKIFLVSDGQDVSTTELIKCIATALNKKIFLIPLPNLLIKFAAKILKKEAIYYSLYGDLQIDLQYCSEVMKWSPPISFERALASAVKIQETDI